MGEVSYARGQSVCVCVCVCVCEIEKVWGHTHTHTHTNTFNPILRVASSVAYISENLTEAEKSEERKKERKRGNKKRETWGKEERERENPFLFLNI